MKTIIWKDTVRHADSEAKDVANELIEFNTIYTGNELVVDHARLLRATDQIDTLQIIWQDQTIQVNEYGAVPDWPNGFCDESMVVASSIIKASIAKQKGKRNARNN